jgi:hypothetical protein
MIYLWIFLLALLSGLLGRMGGAGKSGQWYENILDTKWRDAGCAIIVVVAWCLVFGFKWEFWWIYILIVALHWGAFSTYWDEWFGYDNMAFSGFMTGLALSPVLLINVDFWPIVASRTVILCLSWHCLNMYLPNKVFIWKRDVVEENLRYTVSL